MLPVIYKLDQERTLKLGFRGIARLEKVFGANVDRWNLKELSFEQIAEILAEALRREIPEITADKAMDLVDDYSDISTAIKKTFECINETFGKNDETAATILPEVVN
jgi:lipoate synthase